MFCDGWGEIQTNSFLVNRHYYYWTLTIRQTIFTFAVWIYACKYNNKKYLGWIFKCFNSFSYITWETIIANHMALQTGHFISGSSNGLTNVENDFIRLPFLCCLFNNNKTLSNLFFFQKEEVGVDKLFRRCLSSGIDPGRFYFILFHVGISSK